MRVSILLSLAYNPHLSPEQGKRRGVTESEPVGTFARSLLTDKNVPNKTT